MNKEKFIFAIPSKGRLFDESSALLRSAGIEFEFGSDRQLITTARVANTRQYFSLGLMRPKDIVTLIENDMVQLGIVGSDTLAELGILRSRNEQNLMVQILLELGIGKCNLTWAALHSSGYLSADEFEAQDKSLGRTNTTSGRYKCTKQFDGKTIATCYPGIVRQLIAEELIFMERCFIGEFVCTVNYIVLNGAVESTPSLGIADAIVDLVETGNTLRANNLKPLMTLSQFEGILITNSSNRKGDNPLLDIIRDRICGLLLQQGNPDALIK